MTDYGVLLKSNGIQPANGPQKVPELPERYPTFLSQLKMLSDEISLRLKSREHYPDQKPQMQRLIKDIRKAASLFENGCHNEAALEALHIGVAMTEFDFDHDFREFVQGKRNSEFAAKKPRGLSPAWEAVKSAFVTGMTWRSAFRIFKQAGGNSEDRNFRRGFIRLKKKLGH